MYGEENLGLNPGKEKCRSRKKRKPTKDPEKSLET